MEILQLEFSITCIFTMQDCTAKYSICKETADIDSTELHIINSVLTKNKLKIENGDLFHLVSDTPSQPTYPPIIIPHLQPGHLTPTGPTMMSGLSRKDMIDLVKEYQRHLEEDMKRKSTEDGGHVIKEIITQIEKQGKDTRSEEDTGSTQHH